MCFSSRWAFPACIAQLAVLEASTVIATPSVLYSQPAYESPVRAAPDDLLLLPGLGLAATDTVVYQAIFDTTLAPSHPAHVPTSSTATGGTADIVSVADAPYALAVHLPAVATLDQSYALWVVSAQNEWSNGVKINDARPLWITPDHSYQAASLANLPRVLKVVGRNLQRATPWVGTQLRLVGPTTYTLSAVTDSKVRTGVVDPVATPQIARYVAKAILPASMIAGRYSISVSRDGGRSWVALPGESGNPPQTFAVLTDPVAPDEFPVGAYGCVPDDGHDDLVCIVKAIHAAQTAGGGVVTFAAGVWDLDLPEDFKMPAGCLYTPWGTTAPAVTCDGIIVPANVDLRGDVSATASKPATLSRGTVWAASGLPTFNLQGNNSVSKLYFADRESYTPWEDPAFNHGMSAGSVLQLGVEFSHAPGGAGPVSEGYEGYYNAFTPTTNITRVVITANVFDKPFMAIRNGGLPIDHLMITHNIFGGAFSNAIYVMQNINNLLIPYRFDDSIVAFNDFYPSSYYRHGSIGHQGSTVPADTDGPIATQIGTGLRDDFSNNTADGRSVAYFSNKTISPTNPKGWRAAFFWNTGNNQEMTLVSQNQAFCSGDKAGDGEAISYDGSDVLGGLRDAAGHPAAALRVIASESWTDPASGKQGSTIAVRGALVDPISDAQSTPVAASRFYPGQWLQIVEGAGVGQWRKIASLVNDATMVSFHVLPAFDVLPAGSEANGSIVTMSPAYWQNVTVDNNVDQSRPSGCTKLNQNYKSASGNPAPSSGAMGWFGSTADSAMEGNQQTDTGGIVSYTFFSPAPAGRDTAYAIVKSSNQIRNNVIDGEYEWPSDHSRSGISILSGAVVAPGYSSASNPTNPPIVSFGNVVAGNTISQADASNYNTNTGIPTAAGAIAVTPGINENGPADPIGRTAWKMTDSTLIFHNALSDLTGGGLNRAGIGIASLTTGLPEVWRSVLYANTCSSVQTDLIDHGTGTTRHCPIGPPATCECGGAKSVDLGLTARASKSTLSIGGRVAYVVTVKNNDATAAAHGVTIYVEPSAGMQINAIAMTAGPGLCDPSVNMCEVGVLAQGQTAQITVTETGVASGTWSNTFSVTHQDPDPVINDNGVTMTTIVGTISVDMSSEFNIHGMFNDGTRVTNGGMDTFGNAYSKTLLGSSLRWSGITFDLGTAAAVDAASAVIVPLPAGKYSTLKMLATGVKGKHANQTFTVTYTDGTSTVITQSLSGWLAPQGYAGEATAATMAHRVVASGATQDSTVYLYGYAFAINAAKTVRSLTLPATRNVVMLAGALL